MITPAPLTDREPLVVRLRWFAWRVAPAVGMYLAIRLATLAILGAIARVRQQSLLNYLHGWDGKWYLQVAQQGYVHAIPPGHSTPAQCDLGFFPMLPLILRATHWLFGGNLTVDGVVVSAVAGMAAVSFLWIAIEDRFGTSGARRGLALVLLSPASVVLSMVYTETYIMLGAAVTIWALERRHWVVAGLAAALTTTLDPVGLAVIAPCVLVAWRELQQRGNWRALAAPVLAPLGITTFFLYLWRHTGSFFEYFHAQRAGWQYGPFGTGIPYAFGQFFLHFLGDITSTVKVLSFGVCLAMIWWAWKKRTTWIWITYALVVLGMGAISPIICITPRLLLRAFPLLAAVGATLPKRVFPVALAISVGMMVCLTIFSTSPYWVP